jgi:RimJ/RimL family protein N-acetyltransferase
MKVIETDRLTLRFASLDDAAFILELLNDPDWLKFIGDRGVRTIEQAREYIAQKLIKTYQELGFGLYLVETNKDTHPIGICGLVQRDFLQDVDLGFAFLPRYRGNGFAFEAAHAVIEFAIRQMGVNRVVAIVSENNENSIKLLRKLSFYSEPRLTLPNGEQAKLFALEREH